jgi:hypothetical protein
MVFTSGGNDINVFITRAGIDRYYGWSDVPYRDGDSEGWAWSGDRAKSYSYGEHLIDGKLVHGPPTHMTTPMRGMWHIAPEIRRVPGRGVLHIAPEVRRK